MGCGFGRFRRSRTAGHRGRQKAAGALARPRSLWPPRLRVAPPGPERPSAAVEEACSSLGF